MPPGGCQTLIIYFVDVVIVKCVVFQRTSV